MWGCYFSWKLWWEKEWKRINQHCWLITSFLRLFEVISRLIKGGFVCSYIHFKLAQPAITTTTTWVWEYEVAFALTLTKPYSLALYLVLFNFFLSSSLFQSFEWNMNRLYGPLKLSTIKVNQPTQAVLPILPLSCAM